MWWSERSRAGLRPHDPPGGFAPRTSHNVWSGVKGGPAAAVLLALSACGFSPVYAPGSDALDLRGAVLVEAPDTEEEFAFTGRIEERLGRASAPRYDLGFDLDTEVVGLAIDGSNNITRFNLEGRLDWALLSDGATVREGRETAFTSWSATGSTISTLESERDARRRLMVILADRVVARLLADAP